MFPEWHHEIPESAYFKVPETLKTVRMYPISRFVYVLHWLATDYRGLMRSCKCHIQIVIRKMTNKGIALLCQHINDSLCDCYITKSTMLICYFEDVNWLNRPTIRAIVRIFRPVCKSKIASVATTIICLFETLHW